MSRGLRRENSEIVSYPAKAGLSKERGIWGIGQTAMRWGRVGGVVINR